MEVYFLYLSHILSTILTLCILHIVYVKFKTRKSDDSHNITLDPNLVILEQEKMTYHLILIL